jgi:hypothetical protein
MECAEVIAEEAATTWVSSARLSGIHLGCLAGLSEDLIAKQFPEEHALLMRWEAGRIPINQLTIPGMEEPEQFADRVLVRLMKGWSKPGLVFIGTRSTMILMWNVVKSQGNLRFDRYYSCKWRYGEALIVSEGAMSRGDVEQRRS